MAKFTVEVEIDWIDENGTIDEVVQKEIVSKVSKDISGKVEKDQSEKFHMQISAKVDEMVNETFESLLSVQVVQTDSYGDATKAFPSVREMIKSRFDGYISDPVDSKTGNYYDSGKYDRGQKVTRFEYIMGKAFGTELEKKMAELAKKVESDTAAATTAMFDKMKEILETSVKTELGSKVAELIKLDEILKLGNGKK